MKDQREKDNVREYPIRRRLLEMFKIGKEKAAGLEDRSKPLTNDYNSTFILLVLSISAILAVVILAWPAGVF